MSEVNNPLGLPLRRTKKWKVTESTKVSDPHNVRTPMFCPIIHEDTGKRCGVFMRNWDEMYYEKYGMCEDCWRKYRPDLEKETDES